MSLVNNKTQIIVFTVRNIPTIPSRIPRARDPTAPSGDFHST